MAGAIGHVKSEPRSVQEPYFITSGSSESALLFRNDTQCMCRGETETLCLVKTSSKSVAFRRDADAEAWVGVVSTAGRRCVVFLSLSNGSVLEGSADGIRPVALSQAVQRPLAEARVILEEELGYVRFEFCEYYIQQELPTFDDAARGSWRFVARLCSFGASVSLVGEARSVDVRKLQRIHRITSAPAQGKNDASPLRRIEVKTEIQESSDLPRVQHDPSQATVVGRASVQDHARVKLEAVQVALDEIRNLQKVKLEASRVKFESGRATIGAGRAWAANPSFVPKRAAPQQMKVVDLFENKMFRGLRVARKHSKDELDAKNRIAAHVKLMFQTFKTDVSLENIEFMFVDAFLRAESSTTRVDIFAAFSEVCYILAKLLARSKFKGRVVQVAHTFLTKIKEKKKHQWTWKEAVKYKSFCEEPDASESNGLWSAADAFSATEKELGKRSRWRAFLRTWGQEVTLKLGHNNPDDLEADSSSESSSAPECPRPVGYPVGVVRHQKKKAPLNKNIGLVAALRCPPTRERTPRRRSPTKTPRTPRRAAQEVKRELSEPELMGNFSEGAVGKQTISSRSMQRESPVKLRAQRPVLLQVKQESLQPDEAMSQWTEEEHTDFSIPESMASFDMPKMEDAVKFESVNVLPERLSSFQNAVPFPSSSWPDEAQNTKDSIQSATQAPPKLEMSNTSPEQLPSFAIPVFPSFAWPVRVDNSEIQNIKEPSESIQSQHSEVEVQSSQCPSESWDSQSRDDQAHAVSQHDILQPSKNNKVQADAAPESDDWASVLDMLCGLGGSTEEQKAPAHTINWQTLQEGEWKTVSQPASSLVVEPTEELTPWWEDSSMSEAASWWPKATAEPQSLSSAPPRMPRPSLSQENEPQQRVEEVDMTREPTESPDSDVHSDTTEFIDSEPGSPSASARPEEPSEPGTDDTGRNDENIDTEMLRERWQKISQLWDEQFHPQSRQDHLELERRLENLMET